VLTLQELITRRGLAQNEICEKLSWTPSRLNHYITGRRILKPAQATAIGKVLRARPSIHGNEIRFSLRKKAGA
jgi:transcriptional regulator with XRE-family HTH domain